MNEFAQLVVLDGARLEDHLTTGRRLNEDHMSLYKGRPEEELAGVAPYLFKLEENSTFNNWVSHQGKGNSWGIYIGSQVDFEVVHKHLRRFLMVEMEDTKEKVYFRFYDPRVLRIFLPTCDDQQLQDMFSQVIKRFICEDEDPEFAMIYSLRNGKLHTDRRPATDVFPALLEEPVIIKEHIGSSALEEDSEGIETKAHEALGVDTETPTENTSQETKTPPKKSGGRRFKFID